VKILVANKKLKNEKFILDKEEMNDWQFFLVFCLFIKQIIQIKQKKHKKVVKKIANQFKDHQVV
jgi:hypothetical protein